MRNNSAKLHLAIGAALALGASGLALAQDRTDTQTMQDTQTQPSRTQDPRTTTGTNTEQSTTQGTSTTGTTMDSDRSTVGTTDRSTTGTTGTMGTSGTDRSSTGTTGTTDTAERTREYDQSRSAAQTRGTGQAGDVAWLVVPVSLQSQSDNMSKGCWVKLYSGDNFDGRYVTIVGPAEVRELRSPYGTGLNNWESAVVGPNATVTTYDGANFDDRNATLRAGQRYAELDDSKLGLFEDIESVRVTCSGQGQSGQSSQIGTGQSSQTGTTTDDRR